MTQDPGPRVWPPRNELLIVDCPLLSTVKQAKQWVVSDFGCSCWHGTGTGSHPGRDRKHEPTTSLMIATLVPGCNTATKASQDESVTLGDYPAVHTPGRARNFPTLGYKIISWRRIGLFVFHGSSIWSYLYVDNINNMNCFWLLEIIWKYMK